jgi:hypothetical protein
MSGEEGVRLAAAGPEAAVPRRQAGWDRGAQDRERPARETAPETVSGVAGKAPIRQRAIVHEERPVPCGPATVWPVRGSVWAKALAAVIP